MIQMSFKRKEICTKDHQTDYYMEDGAEYLQTIREEHALLHRNLIIIGRLTRERHGSSCRHCLHEEVTKIVKLVG